MPVLDWVVDARVEGKDEVSVPVKDAVVVARLVADGEWVAVERNVLQRSVPT